MSILFEPITAEIELLDDELWDLPSSLSAADCRSDAGLCGLRDTRNLDDDFKEMDG